MWWWWWWWCSSTYWNERSYLKVHFRERERERLHGASTKYCADIGADLSHSNDLTVSAFIIISYLSRSCLLSIFLFLNAIWYSSMHDFKLDLDPGDGTKMSTCLLSWFLIYPDVGRFLVLLVGMSQLVWMNSLF